MQITRTDATPTNQVMAVFADSAVSFALSGGATFADLAERLDQLGERHTGLPTAIYCRVSIARQPVLRSRSGM